MAEALISLLVNQLYAIAADKFQEKVKLVKGVNKEVKKLTSNLQTIQYVLVDAEKRQVNEENVRDWLDKLKDVSYDIGDVLDEWNTVVLVVSRGEKEQEEGGDNHGGVASEKVCFCIPYSWFCCTTSKVSKVNLRHDIACKIKDLNKKLNDIALEKDRYKFNAGVIEQERPRTTSFVDVFEVYGRDKEKEILISKLFSETNQFDGRGLDIVPIVGMGGIGKTTLAQLVYNDDKVKAHFEKRIWVCVSDPFDEIKIAKAIIEALKGDDAQNLVELDALLNFIDERIRGKRFLLVLDDVWTDDVRKWEQLKQPLKHGAVGSKILVTTRKEEVAIMMGAKNRMIHLALLSNEICWSIFSQQAFSGRDSEECDQLEEIGRNIASKCNGLPLVAKNLGSLMRFKRSKTQWENVLQSKLWELKDFFTPFLFSYYDLPSLEKRCFSYCSILPKDYEIYRDNLIELWMAQDHLVGNINFEKEYLDCFENLAMRSFFQEFEKDYDGNVTKCKMHNIVHDFAKFLMKRECFVMEINHSEEKIDPPTNENARHSTLLLETKGKIPISISKRRNLRTLFVLCAQTSSPLSLSFLSDLTCLRTLSLRYCWIKDFPQDVDKMLHLRYLDLSHNPLKELPNNMCNLFNLQTLRLNFCIELQKLPKGMEKLVNLRHLHVYGCDKLEGLPKGVRGLTRLQTLDMFVVSQGSNPINNGLLLKFEELKHLQLQGHINIHFCRNLEKSEAEKAQLSKKEYLLDLKLHFGESSNGNQDTKDQVVVLDALQPHSNLKSLEIIEYMGSTLSPKWIAYLSNLKKIVLEYCPYCVILPPLGKLPSLEFLKIMFMRNVETVGLEFLGIEINDEGLTKYGVGRAMPSFISFPKLKELHFFSLRNWKRWEDKGGCNLKIMPRLSSLHIESCYKLDALPSFLHSTPMQSLTIIECDILQRRCQKGFGEDWEKISHVPKIEIFKRYHSRGFDDEKNEETFSSDNEEKKETFSSEEEKEEAFSSDDKGKKETFSSEEEKVETFSSDDEEKQVTFSSEDDKEETFSNEEGKEEIHEQHYASPNDDKISEENEEIYKEHNTSLDDDEISKEEKKTHIEHNTSLNDDGVSVEEIAGNKSLSSMEGSAYSTQMPCELDLLERSQHNVIVDEFNLKDEEEKRHC